MNNINIKATEEKRDKIHTETNTACFKQHLHIKYRIEEYISFSSIASPSHRHSQQRGKLMGVYFGQNAVYMNSYDVCDQYSRLQSEALASSI